MVFFDWIKRRWASLWGKRVKPLNDGIDWGMFTQPNLEMAFLGWCFQARHSHGDRRSPGEKPYEVDKQTGLPTSEAALMPGGLAKPGILVALETMHHPDKWASNQILRDPPFGSPAGTVGEALWRIPKSKWTTVEARIVAELTLRWKKCAVEMARKGLIAVEMSMPYEDGTGKVWKGGIGDDGLPFAWHATPHALDVAEKRIPGTPLARGAYSALATASQADRDHAAKVAPWAMKEFNSEEGAGRS